MEQQDQSYLPCARRTIPAIRRRADRSNAEFRVGRAARTAAVTTGHRHRGQEASLSAAAISCSHSGGVNTPMPAFGTCFGRAAEIVTTLYAQTVPAARAGSPPTPSGRDERDPQRCEDKRRRRPIGDCEGFEGKADLPASAEEREARQTPRRLCWFDL